MFFQYKLTKRTKYFNTSEVKWLLYNVFLRDQSETSHNVKGLNDALSLNIIKNYASVRLKRDRMNKFAYHHKKKTQLISHMFSKASKRITLLSLFELHSFDEICPDSRIQIYEFAFLVTFINFSKLQSIIYFKFWSHKLNVSSHVFVIFE